MKEIKSLVVTERTSFGKGASRQLRRDGLTPAVVYGHGSDVHHIAVESHPLSLIVRRANALIELDSGKKTKQLVLVKDVQRDPVRQIIEHVDLVIIKKGETVHVEVPVVIVGEPFSGSTFLLELGTLALNVPATSIPQNIEIDVEGLEAGTQILVQDIAFPEGAVAEDDPEQLVVNIVELRAEELEDSDEETAETAEETEEDSAE
ncbi:MAG TPA: 50S ribosomal protein L25/general stress protein Ctc [Microbacteriaceae bacterium]|nr:50S ribosomal protein L25/general stress protein Ctc [Microbacteriaceae bacterium]